MSTTDDLQTGDRLIWSTREEEGLISAFAIITIVWKSDNEFLALRFKLMNRL
ncbi:hypothetical protein M569_09918 [Genlisea aurea]|uniref:Uncharacterized protein n=1 Tax=Genlisea aurea TaxID=192259 RepID=S8CJM5_9LAMI|nr:hypothetical protein M569_09918 [Genlisea aurea]